MDELNGRRKAVGAGHVAAVHLRAGQRQKRTYALAPRRDEVACELGDQRHARLHILQDQRVDFFHVACEQPREALKRVHSRCGRIMPCGIILSGHGRSLIRFRLSLQEHT